MGKGIRIKEKGTTKGTKRKIAGVWLLKFVTKFYPINKRVYKKFVCYTSKVNGLKAHWTYILY